MNIKEQLKAEIERLRRNNYQDAENGCDEDQCYGYDVALDDMMRFLDTIKEEPLKCRDCALFLNGKCERPGGECERS